MSAGWVAGSVRARALARRRLGTAAARVLAAQPSLREAVGMLVRSPYGHDVRPDDGLAETQRAVAATLLWHLRVLAGWLPAAGAELSRLFAGWFEIANIDEHVQALQGRPAEPPYRLGALATTWPMLAATGSRPALRSALASSVWGDPGGETPRDLQLGPRMRWAERLAARVEPAVPWVAGAVALVVAQEVTVARRPLPPPAAAAAARLLGPTALTAVSLVDLHRHARPAAAWALQGVSTAEELWLAEARWWVRLRTDGTRLLTGSGFGPDRVVGTVAVLAADAALVRGALELAARGGVSLGVFDALA